MAFGSDRGWAALLASGVALFAATELLWWWRSRGRLPSLKGVGSNVAAFFVGELLRWGTFGFRLGVLHHREPTTTQPADLPAKSFPVRRSSPLRTLGSDRSN